MQGRLSRGLGPGSSALHSAESRKAQSWCAVCQDKKKAWQVWNRRGWASKGAGPVSGRPCPGRSTHLAVTGLVPAQLEALIVTQQRTGDLPGEGQPGGAVRRGSHELVAVRAGQAEGAAHSAVTTAEARLCTAMISNLAPASTAKYVPEHAESGKVVQVKP